MDMIFVSSTPHLHSPARTGQIMLMVILALAPATLVGAFVFGVRSWLIIGLCVGACIGFEALFQRMTRRTVTISDLSAAVTGLLLALNMPVSVPFWIPIVGSFVAIIIVKQLFGGLGQNFMNPALGARAFLVASYAPEMAGAFTEPVNNFLGTDIIATATPLANIGGAEVLVEAVEALNFGSLLIGTHGGTIGETSAIALIIGGLFLLFKKIITWHIPVTYIGTVLLMAFFLQPPCLGWGWQFPVFHLLAGGLMLGAFYMATDYSSSPITPVGKIIMGIGCGFFTMLIRLYGSLPEGVSYAILFMNLWVPLIDRVTKPRIFGTKRKLFGGAK